jgi:hypothetical protein
MHGCTLSRNSSVVGAQRNLLTRALTITTRTVLLLGWNTSDRNLFLMNNMIIVQNVDRIFSIKGPSFQILVFILFCFHLQRFLWYKVITLKVNAFDSDGNIAISLAIQYFPAPLRSVPESLLRSQFQRSGAECFWQWWEHCNFSSHSIFSLLRSAPYQNHCYVPSSNGAERNAFDSDGNTKRAILTCALSIILTRVADVIRIFYLMSASPRT